MEGYRLKELRKKNKLTQQQLSDILNVDFTLIGKWEKHNITPNSKNLQQLADYFNVSVDYLLGRTDDPTRGITQQTEPNTVIAFGRGGERKEFNLTDEQADMVNAMLEALSKKDK